MSCNNCKQKNKELAVESIEIKENSSFKLRSQITFEQLSFSYPNFKIGQLTDEMIFDFLKENPNRISLFSEFPENWKELINVPVITGTSREIEVKSITSKDKKEKKNKTK